MTKEQAIKELRVSECYDVMPSVEALDMAIKALEQQPSDDCVSMGVYEQVAWERDAAIEQLKELGYSFGEKIRTSDDCVSRQAVTDAVESTIAKYIPSFIGRYEKIPLELAMAIKDVPPVTPTRKSGLHWIERFDNENKWLECPHCHLDSAEAYNYCPNCGAKFKEEKRGNSDGSN